MTEKRFQKRYVEKNNKVFDTWKNIPISRELDRYSLSHIISHLNGLGEIIDTKIEQGRYCIIKYKELEDENEQLKQTIETQDFNYKNAKGIIHSSEHQIQRLQDENEQLKKDIEYYKIERVALFEYIDKKDDLKLELKVEK